MERQDKKLGGVVTNKKLINAIKKASSYIKGYQTDNIFRPSYVYNRYYNLLLSKKSCKGMFYRYFDGTKIQLIKALRDCPGFDEEDIEQEFYLSMLEANNIKVFIQKNINAMYFYHNSKRPIIRFLFRKAELVRPELDLDLVNLKSANISDVMYQDPERNIEYNNFLSKLSEYERNIIFLIFEREENVNRVQKILGVGYETYMNDIAELYNKIRRYYKSDESKEIYKSGTRSSRKTK